MANSHDVFRVGRATVTKVEEIVLDNFRPSQLIPDWDARLIEQHPDWLPAGTVDASGEHMLLSVHTWVVREDGRIVLVDTGVGNSKSRPYAAYFDHLCTPYLERLKAIGIEPEAVDYVLMTHLHVDHVGWNTRLDQGRWIPTFPNARHIFSRAEHAYFQDPANHNERNRTSVMVRKDSVDPIVDAGLADMIALAGAEPIPGFTIHRPRGIASTTRRSSCAQAARPHFSPAMCFTTQCRCIIQSGFPSLIHSPKTRCGPAIGLWTSPQNAMRFSSARTLPTRRRGKCRDTARLTRGASCEASCRPRTAAGRLVKQQTAQKPK
jgi:hypothetical protein